MVTYVNQLKFKMNSWRIIVINFLIAIYTVDAGLREQIITNHAARLKLAIQEYVKSTATHDIGLITNGNDQNNIVQVLNNAIHDGAAGFLPMYSFTPEDTQHSIKIEPLYILTSRSLIIYCENDIKRSISEVFYDISLIISSKAVPKILLVFIHDVQHIRDMESVLRFVSYEMLAADFNILEITHKGEEIHDDFMTLHQHDYRTDMYTKRPFSTKEDNWYPDKHSNLLGYEFKINLDDTESYIKESDGKYHFSGMVGGMLHVMEELMNATLIVVDFVSSTMDCVDTQLSYIALLYERSEHTVAVKEENICLVIPRILVKKPGSPLWRTIITVILGLLIIFIFWMTSVLMKSNRQLRHPINIMGLIFGQASTTPPRTLIEKILLISIVISSTRYTAMFYTELFDNAIAQDVELNVANFEEFQKSGLHAYMDALSYYELISNEEKPSSVIQQIHPKDTNVLYDEYTSGAQKYDNVSIFLTKNRSISFCKEMERQYEKPVVKVSNFCLLAAYRVYILRRRSLYKDRIDDILLRVLEAGLDWKWSQRVVKYVEGSEDEYEIVMDPVVLNEDIQNESKTESTVQYVIVMLLYVYVIPVAVFLVEFVLGHDKLLRERNVVKHRMLLLLKEAENNRRQMRQNVTINVESLHNDTVM